MTSTLWRWSRQAQSASTRLLSRVYSCDDRQVYTQAVVSLYTSDYAGPFFRFYVVLCWISHLHVSRVTCNRLYRLSYTLLLEICSQLNVTKTTNQRQQQRRLHYFGHVCSLFRMKFTRYPKLSRYKYVHGRRGRSRPKKRWLETVKEVSAEMGMNILEATR